MIKVGGALLTITAGLTIAQDAWQVTITSDTPDFNFHTTITCPSACIVVC